MSSLQATHNLHQSTSLESYLRQAMVDLRREGLLTGEELVKVQQRLAKRIEVERYGYDWNYYNSVLG